MRCSDHAHHMQMKVVVTAPTPLIGACALGAKGRGVAPQTPPTGVVQVTPPTPQKGKNGQGHGKPRPPLSRAVAIVTAAARGNGGGADAAASPGRALVAGEGRPLPDSAEGRGRWGGQISEDGGL